MLNEKFGTKILNIKKMTHKDLEEVFNIENLSNTTRWSKASYSEC